MASKWMVEASVWGRPDFSGWSRDGKLLYLHLRTSPLRTWSGLYQYALGPMGAGVGLKPAALLKALKEITTPKLEGRIPAVVFDLEHETVWVVDAFGEQPQSDMSLKGAARDVLTHRGCILAWGFVMRYPAVREGLAAIDPEWLGLMSPEPRERTFPTFRLDSGGKQNRM